MAGVVSWITSEHYKWGAPGSADCDAWKLVKNKELSIKEERMPVRSRERRHYHIYARQFFYVLTGELTLELNGSMHNILPGRGIEVPPAILHQALNRGTGETRFLVISQPSADEDQINA